MEPIEKQMMQRVNLFTDKFLVPAPIDVTFELVSDTAVVQTPLQAILVAYHASDGSGLLPAIIPLAVEGQL